jgi:hypothetical protein
MGIVSFPQSVCSLFKLKSDGHIAEEQMSDTVTSNASRIVGV